MEKRIGILPKHKRKASLPFEPLDQYVQRKKNLAEVRALGDDPYPHKFEQTSTPAELQVAHGSSDAVALEAQRINVRTAGRILTLRLHGKAGFAHIRAPAAACRLRQTRRRGRAPFTSSNCWIWATSWAFRASVSHQDQ